MHHSSLPLWAKVLIGVLVPLFILGLIGLILFCCWRRRLRRRRAARARSRTPTPAFISNSHRATPTGEQHVPLRGGYLSQPETNRSNRHMNSGSDELHSPVGGPSYDDIPPQPVPGAQIRRSSRHSSGSLQSVQEVPKPMPHHYANAAPIPPPPRSPRRSREFGIGAAHGNTPPLPPLNHYGGVLNKSKRPNLYNNQGIYAGSFNPYSNPLRVEDESPFADPLSPYEAGHNAIDGNRRAVDRDAERFLSDRDMQHSSGGEWPLQADEQRTNRPHSISRKPLPHGVYERVYEN